MRCFDSLIHLIKHVRWVLHFIFFQGFENVRLHGGQVLQGLSHEHATNQQYKLCHHTEYTSCTFRVVLSAPQHNGSMFRFLNSIE